MFRDLKLISIFSNPFYQAALVASMIIVFTLVDIMLPHSNSLMEVDSGPWIVATAMILCFIILNSLIALRTEMIISYWSKSVMLFLGLFALSYAWCFLLTGKHIDEVGSFRWLWFVLTMVYMVFFAIARSVKRVIDIANAQDEKVKSEE